MITGMLFRNYILKLALDNGRQSQDNITKLLEKDSKPQVFLDVGCFDGSLTAIWAKYLKAKEIWGIEIMPEPIKEAKKNGVEKIFEEDLNLKWSIPSESVDVLIASQVVEHLWDTDNFISEIFRVLKPNGYAVIATDNMAGWHNIVALTLGWQIFPLTNLSDKSNGVGNPLALHRGDVYEGGMHAHLRIFTIRALKELFEIHGFVVEKVLREGWFPLPNSWANWILKVDTAHSAGFELRVHKPRKL